MGIDAALADQFQLRQPLQKGVADLRAFADQHQGFGVAQPLRQHVDLLDMIVPDLDVISVKLAEAIEGAQRVEVIIEDRYLHGCASLTGAASISPPAIRRRTSASRSAESRRRRRARHSRARAE